MNDDDKRVKTGRTGFFDRLPPLHNVPYKALTDEEAAKVKELVQGWKEAFPEVDAILDKMREKGLSFDTEVIDRLVYGEQPVKPELDDAEPFSILSVDYKQLELRIIKERTGARLHFDIDGRLVDGQHRCFAAWGGEE